MTEFPAYKSGFIRVLNKLHIWRFFYAEKRAVKTVPIQLMKKPGRFKTVTISGFGSESKSGTLFKCSMNTNLTTESSVWDWWDCTSLTALRTMPLMHGPQAIRFKVDRITLGLCVKSIIRRTASQIQWNMNTIRWVRGIEDGTEFLN